MFALPSGSFHGSPGNETSFVARQNGPVVVLVRHDGGGGPINPQACKIVLDILSENWHRIDCLDRAALGSVPVRPVRSVQPWQLHSASVQTESQPAEARHHGSDH